MAIGSLNACQRANIQTAEMYMARRVMHSRKCRNAGYVLWPCDAGERHEAAGSGRSTYNASITDPRAVVVLGMRQNIELGGRQQVHTHFEDAAPTMAGEVASASQ
jgi:hypothetical protein